MRKQQRDVPTWRCPCFGRVWRDAGRVLSVIDAGHRAVAVSAAIVVDVTLVVQAVPDSAALIQRQNEALTAPPEQQTAHTLKLLTAPPPLQHAPAAPDDRASSTPLLKCLPVKRIAELNKRQ